MTGGTPVPRPGGHIRFQRRVSFGATRGFHRFSYLVDGVVAWERRGDGSGLTDGMLFIGKGW